MDQPSRAKRAIVRAAASASRFEQLEQRSLFSVVNVADFGARPDDGQSDVGAVQAALNASRSGDTIAFSGGVYDLPGGITVPGDRNYLGQNGTTLRGRSYDGQLVTVHASNASFMGLTFDGGGLFVDNNAGGFNQNITIDSNAFKLNTWGVNPNAVTFTCGLANSKITNNYFTGYTGSFAIYGYNYNSLTIANNEIVNVAAGMHIDAFANSGNLLVEQNYITGAKGMGMEFQGAATNLTFQDNWFEHPNLTTTFSQNTNSMAFSVILDNSSNITVRRNTVIAPERPDGYGCRVGFEVGGDNTLVEDNYINGIDQTVAMNDGLGSASATVRNNKFMNYLDGVHIAFPSSIRTLTQFNNGPDVSLTWDTNRAAPGIGVKRYGTQILQALAPQLSVATPTPTPTPALPATASSVYLSDLNWTNMSNGWGGAERDMSNGEEGSRDGQTISLHGTKYSKGLGVHASSQISYNLNGAYTNFISDIGLDDETGGNGSVMFQVFADGVKLFDSGVMKGTDAAKSVNVNVAGRNQLLLVVSGAGDGVDWDHADWAGARLTQTPPPAATTTVRVSDLTPTGAVANGWGQMERNRSNGELGSADGNTITLNGKTYDNGLGVHADSSITYDLGAKYRTFSSDIGVDDEVGSGGTVVFQVWADGVKLYDSGVMTGDSQTKTAVVDVSGRSQVTLVVTNADGSVNCDHGDWAGAQLST